MHTGDESDERVLFVHAHPDDETIATGGTIAVLLDAGAGVTVLTCTRGERGEVVPPELQHLSGEDLGAYRERELAAAMSVLGVSDHRFLGTESACAIGTLPHRYRDSGMQWGPHGAEPLGVDVETAAATERDHIAEWPTLTEADLEAVAADVAAVIADVQPTAVVSYDSRGGYGHPDHIRAHDAAEMAAFAMGIPFYTIVADGASVASDLRVDVARVRDRTVRALEAYRTQLTVAGNSIIHSGGQIEPLREVEAFRLTHTSHGFSWAALGTTGRVTACIVALIAGVTFAMVGTVHYDLAGAGVSLALSAGLLVGLRLLFRTRIVAGFAALGLVLVVGAFSFESPGGSVLIPASVAGFTWSYGVVAIALVALVWPSRMRRARDTMESQADSTKVVTDP